MSAQSKNRTDLQKELDAPIPASAVSQREGGGRLLDYLEGQYVINRLNQVLGQGRWNYRTEDINLVHTGKIKDKYGKEKHTVHYVARVVLEARIGEDQVVFSDVGYGDGSDKENPGKAHELAVKEAVTDAVKRCAKNLGQSMGLALYDKTKANVRDDSEDAEVATGNVGTAGAAEKVTTTNTKKATGKAQQGTQTSGSERADLEVNLKRISAASLVLMKKKNLAKEELIARMKKDYGVETKEALTAPQAKEFADKLTKEAQAS